MKSITIIALVFAALMTAYASPAAPPAPLTASAFRCSSQKHLLNLSINDNGQTIEGPVCAQITVNALRYTAYLGKTYSAPTAGPTLSSVFPSAFGAGGASAPAAPANLDDQFDAYAKQVQAITNAWINQESTDRTTAAALLNDLSTLQATIARSDAVFNASGPGGVLALMKTPTTQAIFGNYAIYLGAWQDSDEVVTKLEVLQAHVNMLPLTYPTDTGTVTGDACLLTNIKALGWANWDKCYDGRYKLLQSTIATALSDANLWTSDSDKASQFVKNMSVLKYWNDQSATLTSDSFVLQSDVKCGVLFNQNQPIVLKLFTTDQTGMFPGQTAQQPQSSTVLNVNCSSAFQISAGAAFSVIENPVYALVTSAPASGGTTAVTKFGLTSDSNVNPYPIALAHARLHDWGDNRYAAHFSFGAGVNPNSSGSTGASPEFLTGFTLSFLRTIFVTAGLDIGKQSSLAGGFHVGDIVPSGVNSVPISTSYTPGFGFAITFTKP